MTVSSVADDILKTLNACVEATDGAFTKIANKLNVDDSTVRRRLKRRRILQFIDDVCEGPRPAARSGLRSGATQTVNSG